ncbi:MFS transporter [Nocardia alni]|uniref:MFS transporter n=1 Tax=Nocardia alni TaxID=2815723 RepID=UPI001C219B7C|nr:MFS transporter [Nocardia alni]
MTATEDDSTSMGRVAVSAEGTSTLEQARRVRKAVFGAAFGFGVDAFDIYVPTVALLPAMNYFAPASMPTNTKAVVSALIFVSTLLGRPLGSLIFGGIADRIGRRRVTLWSMSGCAVCTVLIALLPGYADIGTTSVVLLIVLRLADGIFLGGEYTGATPLAMEVAPAARRGWYGGLVATGSAVANFAISVVTFAVLQFAPAGGPDSAFSVWGWRIPFLVGALLCVVFLRYYSREVGESQTWLSAKKIRNPVRDVVLGRSRRDFAQVFVLMAGVWFASSMVTAILPSTLHEQAHLTARAVTGTLVIVQAIHIVMFPTLGWLSDRVGRRPVLVGNGIAVAVVCATAYLLLTTGWWRGYAAILLLTLLIRVAGASVFAVTPSYLCERFPAATRGTGFGLGYTTPLLITSCYAYYQNWLGHLMPRGDTATVLLIVAGLLIVGGALLGPESRGVDAIDARPAAGAEITG